MMEITSKRKYNIIAMDFDGTLLTSKKTISEKTRNTLQKKKEQSYKIIGVTARNLLSVKDVLDTNIFDYIILNNGSNIYDVENDQIRSINEINKETAKEIYENYKNISYQIDFCTPINYLIKTNEKKSSKSFITYIEEFSEINNTISRINIYLNNEEDYDKYTQEINDKYDNVDAIVMQSSDKSNNFKWITINPKNINKYSTLKTITEELNYSIDEVIFFGDSTNDLILIENAGLGIAMGNAIDSVKEKAKSITLSNDEDGISYFIENNL